MRILASCVVLVAVCLPGLHAQQGSGAADRDPEAVSAQGRLLFASAEPSQSSLDQIAQQRDDLRAAAGDAQFRRAVLALGASLESVWRYREAVSVYSRGLSRFSRDGELFLRRGTASMRLRNFDRALEDLRKAVRFSEDDFESHYRLGLAEYVTGDFRRAARTLEEAEAVAENDDEIVAALHWAYSGYRRADRRGDSDEVLARFPANPSVESSADYLMLMQMYGGGHSEFEVYNREAPESERSSTRGFGVASWHLSIGDESRARAILETVAAGSDWPAIGVIAAEVELERLAE